jgi:hypothetical protein
MMNPSADTPLGRLGRAFHEASFQSQLLALADALASAGKARESDSTGLGAALETESRAAPVLEVAD